MKIPTIKERLVWSFFWCWATQLWEKLCKQRYIRNRLVAPRFVRKGITSSQIKNARLLLKNMRLSFFKKRWLRIKLSWFWLWVKFYEKPTKKKRKKKKTQDSRAFTRAKAHGLRIC